jgi:hypothetical protein
MPDSGHADAAPRNDYEREFVDMMADVDVLIESIDNPKHKKSKFLPLFSLAAGSRRDALAWLLSRDRRNTNAPQRR